MLSLSDEKKLFSACFLHFCETDGICDSGSGVLRLLSGVLRTPGFTSRTTKVQGRELRPVLAFRRPQDAGIRFLDAEKYWEVQEQEFRPVLACRRPQDAGIHFPDAGKCRGENCVLRLLSGVLRTPEFTSRTPKNAGARISPCACFPAS